MPTSEEYRATAEECYRLATEAETETDRLACLDLARTWLEAASREDAATTAQLAERQELAREMKAESEAPQSKAGSGWWQRVLGLLG
jgi:hypothetical protein